MITGFCVLGDDRECTWQWTVRHVIKFLGILFTVGWFYALLEYVYMERTVSLRAVFLSLVDVLNGNTWTHMWYIYFIIGIYFVLPVIKSHVLQDQKNVYYLSGLLFISTIWIPAVNNWLGLSIDMHLPMSGYLFYVVMGALIARCSFADMKYLNVILAAVNMAAAVYLWNHGKDVVYPYTSLPVCIMALCIFILITKNHTGLHMGRKWKGITECTLGDISDPPIFPESDDKDAAHISPARDRMGHDSRSVHCPLFHIICDSVCVKEDSCCEPDFLTGLLQSRTRLNHSWIDTFPVKKIISSIFNDVKQIGYSSLTFEFLVSGGMSIIKIPLFERDMNGLLIVYS